MAKFVILSGPSCVGKGPLQKAFKYAVWRMKPEEPLHPEIGTVPIFHSREPRNGERCGGQFIFERCFGEVECKNCIGDDWKRLASHPCKSCSIYNLLPQIQPGEKINAFSKDKFIVEKVRADFQAIELEALEQTIQSGEKNLVILELFHSIAKQVKPRLLNIGVEEENITLIFISPLSKKEVSIRANRYYMGNEAEVIYREMRTKLEKRCTEKGDKLEARAAYAVIEVEDACNYDHVIVNPFGEDNLIEWGAFAQRGKDCSLTEEEIRRKEELKVGQGAAQILREFAGYCGDIYSSKVNEWLKTNVV